MKAIRLRTEYLENPVGLGLARPRFYWNAEGGVKQTAYQIICTRNGETIWDSGKVQSDAMTHIRYAGKALRSRDRVTWAVVLWDENDQPGETAEGSFELGLLEPSDWAAKWITGDVKDQKNVRFPVDCFEKSFSLHGELASARLYITACGLYEARINGELASDFCLAPGSTDYRKRIQWWHADPCGGQLQEPVRRGKKPLGEDRQLREV